MIKSFQEMKNKFAFIKRNISTARTKKTIRMLDKMARKVVRQVSSRMYQNSVKQEAMDEYREIHRMLKERERQLPQ